MNLKRFCAAALTGALSLSLLAGCGAKPDAAAQGDLATIQANKKLTIGYTEYEPMNYVDEATGDFTGFDTEFARAVCEKLGVEPNFVKIQWDTKSVELDSGNIDCIWNGMTITDDLKANHSISDPYVQNTQVVITRAENKDAYADYANLEGKTVALEAGSAAQSVADNDPHMQKADIVAVAKQTDALLEVKAGTADAAIFDQTMANTMLGEGTNYADLVVCGVFHEEQYGVAFRKDSDLTAKFNEIMAELKTDGTLAALAEKYELTLAP